MIGFVLPKIALVASILGVFPQTLPRVSVIAPSVVKHGAKIHVGFTTLGLIWLPVVPPFQLAARGTSNGLCGGFRACLYGKTGSTAGAACATTAAAAAAACVFRLGGLSCSGLSGCRLSRGVGGGGVSGRRHRYGLMGRRNDRLIVAGGWLIVAGCGLIVARSRGIVMVVMLGVLVVVGVVLIALGLVALGLSIGGDIDVFARARAGGLGSDGVAGLIDHDSRCLAYGNGVDDSNSGPSVTGHRLSEDGCGHESG